MQSLAAQYLCNILINEMRLDSQRVWVRNQSVEIPNDKELFIVVGMIGGTTIGNVSSMVEVTAGDPPETTEQQRSQMVRRERLQVDIASRNNDALLRNWEVVAAMQSLFAQQVQELYNFKIFRVPSDMIDVSEAEGGSQLNRYSVVITCHVWYSKTQTLLPTYGDYYDDFNTRVDDEQTLGTDTPLIEFEITGE